MDVADKIRSGARWLGAAKLITQIYTWVVTFSVMTMLHPGDYGLMAMATVFLSFIGQFEELGLRVKLVQMKDYTIDYARRVFGLVLLTNVVLVSGLAIASPFIADFFNEPRVTAIILVLSVGMMVSALGSIPDALIKRQLDFRSLATVDVLRVIVASTGTLLLAYWGFGVWALVFSSLAGTIIGTLGLLWISPFRSLPSFNFRGMGDTFQFGGLVMAQRLVWWFYSGLDSILIGRYYSKEALGLYATGGQLASLPLEKVGQILNVLSFTGLSRVNDDVEMFRHYLRRATKLVALVMFPAFFGISAIASEFAPVIGAQWAGLGLIAAILALSAPSRCISTVVTESLNSLGKPHLHLRNMIVTAVLFAIGIVAGVPFGLEYIALGVVAASFLAVIQNTFTVTRQVGMTMVDLWSGLWRPAAAGIAMLVILLLVRPLLPIAYPSILGLVATIGLGAVIYIALIYILDRDGFRLVLSLIRKN